MIPINVTHMAIVTRELHSLLLDPKRQASGNTDNLPKASTPLRHTLSTLISFFAASYKSTFGFNDGPPLHDALTIAWLSNPELFETTRYRVDVELTGAHTVGETVVDMWRYKACDDTWGRHGRNCIVAESLNVRVSHRYLNSYLPGSVSLVCTCTTSTFQALLSVRSPFLTRSGPSVHTSFRVLIQSLTGSWVLRPSLRSDLKM